MEAKTDLTVSQYIAEMDTLEKEFGQKMADYQANAANLTGVKPGQNLGPMEVYRIARKAAQDLATETTSTIINPTTGEPAN